MSTLTTALIVLTPAVAIIAALIVGNRAFKKTGSGSSALKKHFLTVVIAAFLCLMLTVGASAAESATEAPAETAATVQVSDEALAAQANAVGSASGMGFIGAALAIGLSAIGAGIALAGGAPAAIGAIAENPKSFGKAMIFVVLGEAVALYGLVVAILIVFLKIPDLSSFVG
ncbi:MAG: hypothetical protein II241_04890, partial [Clostridia bacterium]|nr:hypothetical protein [Clostridia bacterium]